MEICLLCHPDILPSEWRIYDVGGGDKNIIISLIRE